MRIFIIFSLIFTSLPLTADKLFKIDKNENIIAKYITIDLTDEQIKEIGITRFLTLNNKQKGLLRNNLIPNKISIVTPKLSLPCHCDLPFFGIWYKKNKVALLQDSIIGFEGDEHIKDYLKDQKIKIKNAYSFFELNINENGLFFLDSKKISVNDILLLISNSYKVRGEKKLYLIINQPPKLNNKLDLEIIENIKKIENHIKNIDENNIELRLNILM